MGLPQAVAQRRGQPPEHAGVDQEVTLAVGQLVQHVAREVLRMSLDRAGRAATARRRSLVCLPRVARWNSCRPAAQPSGPGQAGQVGGRQGARRRRRRTAARPPHERKRRSSCPISPSASRHPQGDRFQSGACRQVARHHQPGGASSTSRPSVASAGVPGHHVQVVQGQHHPLGGHRSSASAASSADAQAAPASGSSDATTLASAWASGRAASPSPVPGVELVPGGGLGQARGVLREQRGLAAPRRSGHQHEPVVAGRGQGRQQSLPELEPAPGAAASGPRYHPG